MHPQTDIICLVHNRLSVTKKFVQHLFDNTSNFRLIFVDNASTDGTPEFIAAGTGKWESIRHPQNLGVIKGRNSGAEKITADYFVNLDNDQFVKPGWLQSLHDTMEKGYDITGKEAWRMHPPGSGGKVIFHNKPVEMTYFPFRQCVKPTEPFTYIGCGGMLIKTSVYKSIGLFDEIFSPAYFEDPDFSFRAMLRGYRLGWCPQAAIDHLGHQTIGTQTLFDKNEQFLRSWEKFKQKWSPYFPSPVRMTNATL